MVTVDGVEYTEDQLTDAQKYLVSQIQDIENKLNSLRFQLDQLTVSKQAFSDLLVKSFEEDDEPVAA